MPPIPRQFTFNEVSKSWAVKVRLCFPVCHQALSREKESGGVKIQLLFPVFFSIKPGCISKWKWAEWKRLIENASVFHQKTWNAMWVSLVLTFQPPPRSPLSEVRAEVYNQHGDILLSNLITTNSPFQEQDGIQIVTRRCNKANSRL